MYAWVCVCVSVCGCACVWGGRVCDRVFARESECANMSG